MSLQDKTLEDAYRSPQSAPPDGRRTSPDHETTAWPPGVPYIVGNEACERFSFYGMRAILYVHLSSLYVISGHVDERAKDLATAGTHLFNTAVYALPMIGAILADRLIGKYRTIFWLSLVYCAGHAVLSFAEDTLMGMYIGLGLIAVGSGGIKPCVSANVGDQFGRGNWFRVRTIYQIFYFSINFGSFFSTLLIPWVKEAVGTKVAFGIPGILMFIATIFFWAGRKKFVHVPAKPGGMLGFLDTLSSVSLFLVAGHFFFTAHSPWWVMLLASVGFLVLGLVLFSIRQKMQPDSGFLAIMFYTVGRFFAGGDGKEVSAQAAQTADADLPLARNSFWAPAVRQFGHLATEGPVAVLKIVSVFLMVSVFWALFDQHSSSWIRQAEEMELSAWFPFVGSFQAKPSQIPALNPLMVMALIPIMNLVYNFFDKIGIRTTPLRRMTVGMLISALSFVSVAILQGWIDEAGKGKVWFMWQVIPFLLITIGEVMVSITGLEFAYTQAPKAMKSTIMGFWLMSVALGNVLVALLAAFAGLPLEQFFWVFAGLMGFFALIFGVRSYFYVQKDYPQE